MKNCYNDRDMIVYVGDINRGGYNALCDTIHDHKLHNKVSLILITFGGDPNAGFRIARALQHHYEDISIMIPSACKSAGTLVCTGANNLIISDTGELGPLDIQMNKSTELFENTSGLDLPQAFSALEINVKDTLKNTLIDMRMGGKLSTKIAAEIATTLVTGIYAPIYAQIDPLRLGEMHRATMIAHKYGSMLAEKGKNINLQEINSLLLSYPSHGFVIDRKEARNLFKNVKAPDEQELLTLNDVNNILGIPYINGSLPEVICFPLLNNGNAKNEHITDPIIKDDNPKRSTKRNAEGNGEQTKDNG